MENWNLSFCKIVPMICIFDASSEDSKVLQWKASFPSLVSFLFSIHNASISGTTCFLSPIPAMDILAKPETSLATKTESIIHHFFIPNELINHFIIYLLKQKTTNSKRQRQKNLSVWDFIEIVWLFFHNIEWINKI